MRLSAKTRQLMEPVNRTLQNDYAESVRGPLERESGFWRDEHFNAEPRVFVPRDKLK